MFFANQSDVVRLFADIAQNSCPIFVFVLCWHQYHVEWMDDVHSQCYAKLEYGKEWKLIADQCQIQYKMMYSRNAPQYNTQVMSLAYENKNFPRTWVLFILRCSSERRKIWIGKTKKKKIRINKNRRNIVHTDNKVVHCGRHPYPYIKYVEMPQSDWATISWNY